TAWTPSGASFVPDEVGDNQLISSAYQARPVDADGPTEVRPVSQAWRTVTAPLADTPKGSSKRPRSITDDAPLLCRDSGRPAVHLGGRRRPRAAIRHDFFAMPVAAGGCFRISAGFEKAASVGTVTDRPGRGVEPSRRSRTSGHSSSTAPDELPRAR